jgi:hypothetical protein
MGRRLTLSRTEGGQEPAGCVVMQLCITTNRPVGLSDHLIISLVSTTCDSGWVVPTSPKQQWNFEASPDYYFDRQTNCPVLLMYP